MPRGRPRGSVGQTRGQGFSSLRSLASSLSRRSRDELDSDTETNRTADSISQLGTKLQRLKERLLQEFENLQEEFTQAIEDLRESVKELTAEKDELKERCDTLERKVEQLEAEKSRQAQEINKNERFSRRNNIRIVGFPTTENEICQEIATKVLEEVGVPSCRIERAHRDGRPVPGRSRHLLVKSSFYQDKITVMKNARQALAEKSYYIVDDLTKMDLAEKKKWKREVQELYQQGTRLRFSGGCWRGSNGRPYDFERSDS